VLIGLFCEGQEKKGTALMNLSLFQGKAFAAAANHSRVSEWTRAADHCRVGLPQQRFLREMPLFWVGACPATKRALR